MDNLRDVENVLAAMMGSEPWNARSGEPRLSPTRGPLAVELDASKFLIVRA